MKQIDYELSEAKNALEYVTNQFPRTLEKIQESINKFNNEPDENHPYKKTMNEIQTYTEELLRLVQTEQQNNFLIETLEEIKDEDYC